MASQAKSTENNAELIRTRRQSSAVAEVVGMIQTEGSDSEEDDEGDSEEDDEGDDEAFSSVENFGEDETDNSETEREWGGIDLHQNNGEIRRSDAVDNIKEEVFSDFEEPDWHEDLNFSPPMPPFSGFHGLHMPAECQTPIDFFSAIFTDDLLKLVTEETNRYAKETIEARGELKRSLLRKWPKNGITVNDLVGFFAICVHMGLVQKPEVKDYWSTDPLLETPFPRTVMTRDKFCLILAMLHVSNNADFIPRGQEGHDPLHRIRPVYTHLQQKFRALYTPKPEDNISMDEPICLWLGKPNFQIHRHLGKGMSTKWGIKHYELCDSESGYVLNFEIFGAKPRIINHPEDIVMRFCEPFLDQGRTVYVDKYYTCPELTEKLVARDTHCVGPVRPNCKGMPPQLKTQPLPQRGQVQAYRQGAATVLRWMGREPVHFITTKTDPTLMINVTTRRGQVQKPAALQEYILNMAEEDKSDQLLTFMPLIETRMKCWKKLFFHLFTLSLIQGSTLFNIFLKSREEGKMSQVDFAVAVGASLKERYQRGRAAERQEAADVEPDPDAPGPSAAPSGQRPQPRLCGQQNDHFSCPLPPIPSGRKNYRRCHVCIVRSRKYLEVKARQTPNWCKKCGIPLCDKLCQPNKAISCFEVYHTIQNFAEY